jgi:outer membrane protein assembly factor BamB
MNRPGPTSPPRRVAGFALFRFPTFAPFPRFPLFLRFLLFPLFASVLHAQTEGTLKWAAPFVTGGYIVSSPAVGADGTVYLGSQDRHLYAIAPDGRLKWRFLTGDWVDATPALAADGTIYVGSWDGNLYALRDQGTSARELWRYSTGSGNYLYSSPAVGADGTIYIGGGDGNFHAVHPDGRLKWTYPAADWIDSSPALGPDGTIYYGSWDGFVYALRDDGTHATERWRHATAGPVLASPAVGRDGTVFVGSQTGRIYALDAATGERRWLRTLEAGLEGSIALGPDGTLYFGDSAGDLHAWSASGEPRWRFATGDAVVSTPTVRADGTVLVGSTSSALFALSPDGQLRWRAAAADWVDSSPVVAPDGTIYVGSYDRRVYAFHGSGSSASQFSAWPMFRRDSLRTARLPATVGGGRLINLSTLGETTPDFPVIVGFAIAGAAERTKPFLIRSAGPALTAFGVAGVVPDPGVLLYVNDGSERQLASNRNWQQSLDLPAVEAATARVGAFPFAPASRDAALALDLNPRAYAALTLDENEGRGQALVEVYDTAPADTAISLVNLSTRAWVGPAALVPGFVVDGPGPVRLLVRGIGPMLAAFGIRDRLERPELSLLSGTTVIASNLRWTDRGIAGDLAGVANLVGAFPLDPRERDTALLVTLAPGAYTVRLAGLDGSVGQALVELYVVP